MARKNNRNNPRLPTPSARSGETKGGAAVLAEESDGLDLWEALETMTATISAPADWAIAHDHYLYGTPKSETTAD